MKRQLAGITILTQLFFVGQLIAQESIEKHGLHASDASAPAQALTQTPTQSQPIPESKIEFSDKAILPVSGVQGSVAYALPIRCSAQGVPFLTFFESHAMGFTALSALDPKGGFTIHPQSVDHLYDIQTIGDFFVSESHVGILVRATRDSQKSPNTMSYGPGMPSMAIYPGLHYDFLLLYDLKGQFLKIVELPETFHVQEIVELPSEAFLALAFDQSTARAHLFLLDSNGRIARTLPPPGQIENSPALQAAQDADPRALIQAAGSLTEWKFAQAKHKIFLYQSQQSAPLWEADSAGNLREIPLQYPDGFQLYNLIPSSDHLFVSLVRAPSSSNGASAQPLAPSLFELNPTDGSLIRQISSTSTLLSAIACEHDGVFRAFSVDQAKVSLRTADLP